MFAPLSFNQKRARFFLLCLLLIHFTCFTQAIETNSNFQTYLIQPGDTISDVLYNKYKLTPVYGVNGFIAEAIKLNPDLLDSNGNFVKVGLHLKIPKTQGRSVAIDFANVIDVVRTPATSPMSPEVAPPPLMPAPPVAAEIHSASSNVLFDFGGFYSAINGVDSSNNTSGRFISNLNQSLKATWQQNWSADFQSGIYLGFAKTSFIAEKNGLDVQGRDLLSSNFGLNFSYFSNPRFKYGLNLEMKQMPFYRGLTTTQLEIFQVPLLKMRPQVEVVVLQKAPLKLSTFAGFSYFSSGTYDTVGISAGYGFDFGLKLSQTFSKSQVNCQTYFDQRNQNTSVITLSEKQVGFNCGYSWELK